MTVDYVLANVDAISSLPMPDLNTSDHLPLMIEMISEAGFDGYLCHVHHLELDRTSGAILICTGR